MRSTFAVLSIVLSGVALSGGCNIEKASNYSFCDQSGCYTCDQGGCIPAAPFSPTGGPDDTSGGSYSYCYSDNDCTSASYCDYGSGYCYASSNCSRDQDCGLGALCDSRSTCVPGPTECSATSACAEGCYCDSGRCVETSLCALDSDCTYYYGPDFVCLSGTCAPAVSSVDAGTIDAGGTADGGAADGGTLLDGGNVKSGDTACVGNGDCPAGRDCVSLLCRLVCTTNAACGTGSTCIEGYCQ